MKLQNKETGEVTEMKAISIKTKAIAAQLPALPD